MNNVRFYFPGYQINNHNYVLIVTTDRRKNERTQGGYKVFKLTFKNLKVYRCTLFFNFGKMNCFEIVLF